MGKLTIQDIATILVEKNGFDKRDANKFASVMFALIQERLETDHLVKVKGLGTFKIVDVEARESVSVRTGERVIISSHAKVSFTPDATMKELVNRPFSQFETVVLNEGVEFEDMKEEEESESELDPEPDPAKEEEMAPVAAVQPLMEIQNEEPKQPEEPVVPEESVAEEEPVVVEEAVEAEVKPVEAEEPVVTDEPLVSDEPADDIDDDWEEPRPWGRWILAALGGLALMALSAWGGYYYGSQQAASSFAAIPDTVIVHDTIKASPAEVMPSMNDEPDAEPTRLEPATEAAKVEPIASPLKTDAKPAKAEQKVEAKPEPIDKYAQKDARVRLGAYRIVGLDHEVKVQPGQTFYSICRGNLGPDMECYVEVFNDLPQNPKVKEGQIIKIPKLQLKKRKK